MHSRCLLLLLLFTRVPSGTDLREKGHAMHGKIARGEGGVGKSLPTGETQYAAPSAQ